MKEDERRILGTGCYVTKLIFNQFIYFGEKKQREVILAIYVAAQSFPYIYSSGLGWAFTDLAHLLSNWGPIKAGGASSVNDSRRHIGDERIKSVLWLLSFPPTALPLPASPLWCTATLEGDAGEERPSSWAFHLARRKAGSVLDPSFKGWNPRMNFCSEL